MLSRPWDGNWCTLTPFVIHLFSMWIKLQEGSVHTVKVVRLMDYGAIVEFPSGSSSLLHISQLSRTRVSSIEGSSGLSSVLCFTLLYTFRHCADETHGFL